MKDSAPDFQIFSLYNDIQTEDESNWKGYRVDIYVKIKEYFYNLRIFNILRITQEFESEIKSTGFYSPEPNLVLVEEVTREKIKPLVAHLYEQRYFDEIKPVNKNIVDTLELLEY